jgi:hypothetical protein
MKAQKLNLALADQSLAKKLQEINDLEKTDGPLCYRGETNWQLDVLEEEDDKARATFELAGLNPTNPHHRDLMLDILIDHLHYSGRPSWNESDFFALLKDVVQKRTDLNCSVSKACSELAGDKNRKPVGGAHFYPDNYSAATLRDRYYDAIKYFEERLDTDRFQYDWPVIRKEELKALLDKA